MITSPFFITLLASISQRLSVTKKELDSTQQKYEELEISYDQLLSEIEDERLDREASEEQVEKLKPYILLAVFSGEMYPYHFARSIDYKNDCQIYGTYIDGGYMFEICDCENAEIERKKIGFESIKDYYRKRNSKYKCKK